MPKAEIILVDEVERAIHLARGHRVMLDEDLAALYGVEVRTLNQAVSRNIERFPSDFMFQLTAQEAASLRSQSVILKVMRGQHRKYDPRAFTEQGVAMLSSVLRSPRAIEVNIEIMRAFVRLRRMLGVHAEMARKLKALEKKYDRRFRMVFQAIRALMTPPSSKASKRIGFKPSRRPETP